VVVSSARCSTSPRHLRINSHSERTKCSVDICVSVGSVCSVLRDFREFLLDDGASHRRSRVHSNLVRNGTTHLFLLWNTK